MELVSPPLSVGWLVTSSPKESGGSDTLSIPGQALKLRGGGFCFFTCGKFTLERLSPNPAGAQ